MDDEQGYGIRSVRSRLLDLYGDRQTFTLANAADGGAVAEIRMPFRQLEKSEASRPQKAIS
jgi:hypothetical protein